MSYVHRTMIVAAAAAPAARALLGAFPSAQGMLSVGLSPTGDEPATHYVSAGPVDAQLAMLMPCKVFILDEQQNLIAQQEKGQPEVVVHLAKQVGSVVSVQQVQAIFNACDISVQTFEDAALRLGLQIVRPLSDIESTKE